eukprot:Selendium_serpulae@DN5123_c0_g1_i1.p1
MGIKGLSKFLADNAPKAVKEQEFASFMGQCLAIDASMSLYQFMVAIREGDGFQSLTNEAGETTSHISGMLSRVVRLMEHGIKPVYVFDGKPPELKSGELALRRDRRAAAEKQLAEAVEKGDKDEIKKFTSRTVKVTKEHNEDVKTLLRLIGIPVVEAPCEAEAQCAVLCSANKVYGVGTEDADALTFGASILVRNLNFSSEAKNKHPIVAINLETALEELGLTMDQFIDFCILCGCDYTADTIRGVGPATAFTLIKQHKNIETIIANIDTKKHPVPDHFPFAEAREFFKNPEVTSPEEVEIKWRDPDFDALKKFLVDRHGFNVTRIDNYIARLKKAKGKTSQTRLESFFGATTTQSSTRPEVPKGKAKAKSKSAAAAKRKRPSPASASTTASNSSSRPGGKAEETKTEIKTDAGGEGGGEGGGGAASKHENSGTDDTEMDGVEGRVKRVKIESSTIAAEDEELDI